MKSLVPLFFVSTVVGCSGALVTGGGWGPAFAQTAPVGQASVARQEMPPRIPPVRRPPLYPDPLGEVVHWTSDDLRKIYNARVEGARISASAAAGPRFQSASFRTHSVGLFFRVKFDSPRPANRSGIVSLVDDADQHEGVTDFYVMAGGSGQIVTDGVIENRQYGHNPRGSAETGAKATVVFPGEFNGQPRSEERRVGKECRL